MNVKDAQAIAKNRHPKVVSFLFISSHDFQYLWHDIVNNYRKTFLHGVIPARRPQIIAVDKHLKIHNAGTNDMDIIREANREAEKDYEARLYELRIGDITQPEGGEIRHAAADSTPGLVEELIKASPRNAEHWA